MVKVSKRECGTCTKCCEGWLEGEALGQKFYPGKPCGFVTIGKGCNFYALRPKDPCVSYNCGWITNTDLPEWIKPDQVDTIVNYSSIDEIPFIRAVDAGQPIKSKTLSWLIQYALNNHMNLVWEIEGEVKWIGSSEFNQAMTNKKLK
jgi:hypothetical protein